MISLAAVLLILWLALRSWRIILAAAGQPGLRAGDLRRARPVAGRHAEPDLGRVLCAVRRARRRFRPAVRGALPRRAARYRRAAPGAGRAPRARPAAPLALAAAATALGFFAFVPTSYRGLSELGLDRRPRHDHRLPDQHHAAAGAAGGAEPAGRGARRWALPGSRRSIAFSSATASAVVALTLGVGRARRAAALLAAASISTRCTCRARKAEAVATFLELRTRPADRRQRDRDRRARSRRSAEQAGAAPRRRCPRWRGTHDARAALSRPTRTRSSPRSASSPRRSPRRCIRAAEAAADRRRERRGADGDRRQCWRNSPRASRAPAARRRSACRRCWRSWRRPTRRRAQRAAAAFVEPLRALAGRACRPR